MNRYHADQPDLHFVMRLGTAARQRCMTGETCPDIFLLNDGSYAVIGRDMTNELVSRLPAYSAIASYERIVVIPRETLVAAREDIPIG